ncbi:MAG: transposase [Acidobacteriota bacterium]|nr:transposase [Acidobacteriota bacterium]
MPRPPRLEFSGAVYHVIARGNEQRDVFRDDADRELYLRRLAHYRDQFRFRLYAYCLMSNHVHLALETGPVHLSRIVLSLHGSYAQAFNQRHQRVGHLFQGRYKAFLVQKTSYLLALVRYIHENPVKAGLVSEPRLYRWSSDRFYRGAHAPDWLDTRGLFELLGADPGRAARRYRTFMTSVQSEAYEDLKAVAHVVKGDERFSRRALEKATETDRRRSWSIEKIARVVASRAGLDLEEVRSREFSRERARARAITGLVARTHCHIPLTKVSEFFRRDESTLVRDCQRLRADLAEQRGLARDVAAIVNELDQNPIGVNAESLNSVRAELGSDPDAEIQA